jgi:hypothetical protein
MRTMKSYIVLFVLILHTSCEKVTDYYLGINQQPEFTENTFKEGMNIFGLMRPDARGGFNKSFVYVQQNWPVLEYSDQSFVIIKDVDIQLIHLKNGLIIDTIAFPLMAADTFFSDTLYRSAQPFIPIPGDSYRLICIHPEFPEAIGETLFPYPPLLVENSLVITGQQVEFEVEPDRSIKMFDVYISGDGYAGIAGRYVTSDSLRTKITLTLPAEGPVMIKIYGYDEKLAVYYANTNTSLNFNKYRTTFSTLEEGFGVFGSLNMTEFLVD